MRSNNVKDSENLFNYLTLSLLLRRLVIMKKLILESWLWRFGGKP